MSANLQRWSNRRTLLAGGHSSIGYAENTIEARTHLVLGLAEKSIERGKIGHIGCARQQSNEARRRRTRVERTGKTQAQDLREIIVEPHCWAQHLGLLGAQHAQ